MRETKTEEATEANAIPQTKRTVLDMQQYQQQL
jgi:hypothetical protein